MFAGPVRHAPLGEQLLDPLRALIVRGEIGPGTHLVEGTLAEQYGVSRGPVRDALRQLEIEGLVESRKRGAFVRGLTDPDLVELYAVRETMARLADADWRPVDDAVAAMRTAAAAADPVGFGAADLDFHSAFYVIGGNRRLAATWGLHRPIFAAMLEVTNTDRDLGPVAQDHADLSATIRSGEVEPALAALAVHLVGSCTPRRTVLAERLRTAS